MAFKFMAVMSMLLNIFKDLLMGQILPMPQLLDECFNFKVYGSMVNRV